MGFGYHPRASASFCPEIGRPSDSEIGSIVGPGEQSVAGTIVRKLAVKHGRIENLGMSPMTMVFRVTDPAFLTLVKPGDRFKMTVERVDGALNIVALQRVS